MTYTATQSGFTDQIGTVQALVDGDSSTAWQPALYASSTGHEIVVDTGGYFDATTLARVDVGIFGTVMTYGGFGIQLSTDGVDYYNMPDNTSSIILGNVASTVFTPYATAFTARYIKLKGTGGACATPPGGEQTKFTNLAYLKSDGSALTLGSNTNPFTGTPDTNAIAPSGSTTPARASGVGMEVMDTYASTGRVSAVGMEVMDTYASTALVSGMGLEVMRSITSIINPHGRGLIVG